MASSRRRFLTTLSLAAAGGAASLGGRASAWSGPTARTVTVRDSFSPTELLKKHAFETVAAANPTGETQSDPRMPTPAEVESWYTDRRNWGRWGDDDQKGAAAAGLVRTGRKVSMSRVFEPEQHFMRKNPRPGGASSVVDYYGFIYHGQTITHIDALCHMWDNDGMWQGRDPNVEVTTPGRDFWHHRCLGRWHHHAWRPDRRPAPPRRIARDTRPASARVGDRRDRARPGG